MKKIKFKIKIKVFLKKAAFNCNQEKLRKKFNCQLFTIDLFNSVSIKIIIYIILDE